jgi:NTE family protein
MHPSGSGNPSNTSTWLNTRNIDAHHHLRLDHDLDFLRLARRLTDQGVGLVLSGGSARGSAHVGVYRALKEAGIDYDMVGGTSMGALVGAAFAMEYDLPQLFEFAGQFMTKKAIIDYTYPSVALCSTRKVSKFLQKLSGDLAIEDLFLPYFCVSSNLSKSIPVIHSNGLLWMAVRCSISIPGVFTPVSHEGDILVDGGVMNNLPIDIMQEQHGIGTVIAVNVTPKIEKNRHWDFPPSISGWKVLERQINPFAKPMPVPRIGGTMLRTLEVNSVNLLQQTRGLADLIIEPDTYEYKSTDWEAYPYMVEIGYQEATKKIAEWQKSKPVSVR